MSITNNQYPYLSIFPLLCLFLCFPGTDLDSQQQFDITNHKPLIWSESPEGRSALPFICNGSGYLSTHFSGGSDTKLWRININENDVSLSLLHIFSTYFNAIGYHAGTQSFYGAEQGSNNILRLQLDGTMEIVHSESSISGWNALAGDCSFNDQYIAYERSNGTAYIYDLDPFTKVSSVALDWHPNTGINNNDPVVFADVVFDPENPSWVYGYHGQAPVTGGPNETKGWILRFNVDPSHPDYGLMQKVMEIPSNILYGIGAMFFGADLGLYLYGRVGPSTDNNELFRIDLDEKTASSVHGGPSARNVDGCSCLSGFQVTKTAETNPVPCGEDVFFNIEVYWYGRTDVTNVSLKDTINFGEEVEVVSAPEWENISINPIAGGHVVTLEKSSMQKGDRINARIRVGGAEYGSYCNQAFVRGKYDGRELLQPSDAPEVRGWLDPTCLEVQGAGDISDEIATSTSPVCPSGGTGEITLEWSGFKAGTEYIISPSNDTITASDGELVWSDLPAGTYSLSEILETGDSCSYNAVLDIRIPTWDEFTNPADSALCRSEPFQMEATHPMIEVDRWRLLGSAEWNETPVNIPAINQQTAGSYEVEYRVSSCTWRDTFAIDVLSAPFADYVEHYTGIPEEPIQIVSEQLSQDIQSWSWSPPSGLNCDDCPEPMASDENIDRYTLRVTDENGCMDTVRIRIDWLSKGGLYVPNTFTPNNDGINDIFTVYPSEWVLEFLEAEIFNRWGDLVYHVKGQKPKWDGRFNGQRVSNDVYVLVLKYRTQDQKVRIFAGDITVAR